MSPAKRPKELPYFKPKERRARAVKEAVEFNAILSGDDDDLCKRLAAMAAFNLDERPHAQALVYEAVRRLSISRARGK